MLLVNRTRTKENVHKRNRERKVGEERERE